MTEAIDKAMAEAIVDAMAVARADAIADSIITGQFGGNKYSGEPLKFEMSRKCGKSP